ncbi:hypothetical protein C8Q77DRAFT_418584 [Trametes polyzona]|nr:hypothetical protein C8Q77DRAFT_418584 [Trametes polyzona]
MYEGHAFLSSSGIRSSISMPRCLLFFCLLYMLAHCYDLLLRPLRNESCICALIAWCGACGLLVCMPVYGQLFVSGLPASSLSSTSLYRRMPRLFEGRESRSAMYALGAAMLAHVAMRFVPHSTQVFSLMQTSVAILAIASLGVMIVTHHRRHGEMLTQTQEEAILLVAFGLMWFALLIGWRALQQRGADPGLVGTDLASASRTGRGRNAAQEGFGGRPYPCSSDSVYCVVEEWTYW